jgi:hypothetical protein
MLGLLVLPLEMLPWMLLERIVALYLKFILITLLLVWLLMIIGMPLGLRERRGAYDNND